MATPESAVLTMPIAAIGYTSGNLVEPLLHALAAALDARGVPWCGLLQGTRCATTPFAPLTLWPGGEPLDYQDTRPGISGCRLDADALARAGQALRARIAAHSPRVVLFNKFGEQEARGDGLRDEMAAVVSAGLPLLTAVATRWQAEWDAFTGGAGVLLPADLDAALAWCDRLA